MWPPLRRVPLGKNGLIFGSSIPQTPSSGASVQIQVEFHARNLLELIGGGKFTPKVSSTHTTTVAFGPRHSRRIAITDEPRLKECWNRQGLGSGISQFCSWGGISLVVLMSIKFAIPNNPANLGITRKQMGCQPVI
ncbi:MAG: hypothetical protein Ct9H90mP23_2200 [Methanobacteriota archaeon]|nr:MAG: hypothetical protein Ct9H90mP23_2200 [Euryarchaeota archaeon]